MKHRRWLRRLLGCVLLLSLLEIAMQTASPLIQGLLARNEVGPDSSDAITVLCVGDSHTYGLHLPQIYAYPAVLKGMLGARYASPPHVVNRGVPGQSSAMIAQNLPEDLKAIRPDVVLILVGINDTWNTQGDDEGVSRFLSQLKLVRLFRVLAAGVTTAKPFSVHTDAQGEILVDRGDGPRRVNEAGTASPERSKADLLRHTTTWLKDVVAICREWSATPVLMTYVVEGGHFTTINQATRDAATSTDTPLIDHAALFRRHFENFGYATLMFNDQHPNLSGYRLMAEGIDQGLTEAGLVPGNRLSTAEQPTHPPPSTEPSIELLPNHQILLKGPEGWAYQLLISKKTPPNQHLEIDGLTVAVADDDVLAVSRTNPTSSGTFRAAGKVVFDIPDALFRMAGNESLQACLLLLYPPNTQGTPRLAAVSKKAILVP